MNARAIERLSVLDGVVVATGYCHPRDTPVVVLDGNGLPNQICTRFPRPDVAKFVGTNRDCGFRVASVCGPVLDNSKIGIRFGDGTVLRRTLPNVTDAHTMFNEFAEIVEASHGRSMIELGSRARSGTVYKTHFPSLSRYVGVDVMDGPNVDIVADAHTLSKTIDDQFDYALSVSVFEHLIMPWVAAFELNKVMKLGGLIYIQSHPTYPLHDEPWDFFRFSANAWSGLFNKFTGFEVIKTGYSLEASIVPMNAENRALQGMDLGKNFLVSAVIAKKVAEPTINWEADPSMITDIKYSHAATRPALGMGWIETVMRTLRLKRSQT